jgi:class 3 adenylate cyclase
MTVETRIDGEKRWVASLMADIVGSTEMTEQLGAENTYLLFRDIMQDAWDLIAEHNGHAVEFAGDSVFALFGAPIAVENSAIYACRAAVALHKLLESRQSDYFAKYGVRPQFRIGIAGGEVLVAGMDLDDDIKVNALGSTVNLSARLQTQGQGGEILCSESILEEVEGSVTSEFLGKQTIKGYRDPVPIHKITKVYRSGSSFDTRYRRGSQEYVGRDAQRDMLTAWAVDKQHDDLTLLICGPAGIGKSRLLHEVSTRTGSGLSLIVGNCTLASMQRPLAPLVEVIRKAAGIAEATPQGRVVEVLNDLSGADASSVEILASLFSKNPTVQKAATHDHALIVRQMITRVLGDLMTDRGSLIVIEDVHWIDPLSADVLQSIIDEKDPNRKLLLLGRNENNMRWINHRDVRRIDLKPLVPDDIRVLTRSLFSGTEPSDKLVELLHKQSEGNPLFVEEILRHLKHNSDEPNSAESLTILTPSSIGSLQNLVFSRFDRLGDTTKNFLRKASVIGRSFTQDQLKSLGIPQAVIDNNLAVSEQRGLLTVADEGDRSELQFSHALVHEAIYNSIPLAERKPMHGSVAQALEQLAGDDGHSMSEVLAEHCVSAGMFEKALKYIHISARKAFRVYALDTCDYQISRAFDLVKQRPNIIDDTTYREMLVLWARALDLVVNYVKLERVLGEHLGRLQRGNPTKEVVLVQMFIAKAMCHGGRYGRSIAQGEHALEMAKRLGDAHTIAMTKVILMRIYVDSGQRKHSEVVRLFEETREIGESGVDQHLSQMRLYFMLASYRRIGRLKECERLNGELYRLGDASDGATYHNSRAYAYAGWSATVLGRLKDNSEATMIAAQETFKYTIPGTGDWRIANVALLGARVADGDETVSVQQFEDHAAKCDELGDMTLRNATLFQIVIAQFLRGHIRDGWRRLQEALPLFERTAHDEHRNFVSLIQAEFYLSIAGLLQRDGPRPKLGLADILQVLALKPVARKRSEKQFRQLMANIEGEKGFMMARSMAGLGLLARSRGQKQAANDMFEQSAVLFEAEDMSKDADRVRGYLVA